MTRISNRRFFEFLQRPCDFFSFYTLLSTMAAKANPKVFFDVSIGGVKAGAWLSGGLHSFCTMGWLMFNFVAFRAHRVRAVRRHCAQDGGELPRALHGRAGVRLGDGVGFPQTAPRHPLPHPPSIGKAGKPLHYKGSSFHRVITVRGCSQ